ncbi:Transcriptional regulator ATRX-like 1, partial [Homarus americanus]
QNVPKVYKGYMNLNISSDEDKGSDYEDDEEEEEEEEDDDDDSDFEESEEDEDDKPKSKRKRIKKMTSSSDESGDEENKEDSPSKHKKIRRVIRDEDLLETTKNATQEEEERRKRISERQKRYNQIFEVDVESDQKDLGKLVLDFDPETKSELVSVHEKLVKFLKPHQFKGITFMWNATVESVEMMNSKPGSGCILAHCMGLGKTLQVIAFVHTLMTNKKTARHVSKVMVCCPVNTVYNWVSEFTNWLKGKMLPFDVVELASAKDLWGRAYRLDDWWREGGVCIIGYDMFRNLSNSKSKRYKGKMKEIFQRTLINPGPDLMVCDEGHILKNEKTALSIAINQINTKRRIVLTGTPLQNNLKEYHCMIQFVKPNLLGTKKEFMNRFVNPIEQGQCVDAMPRDVRRMKRRAHILHNMLEGCVQRFDYTVLKPFLPPKLEFVVSVQLSDIQRQLYQYYLDNLAQGGPKRQGSGLFVDFGALSRVWTHPKVLELAVRRSLDDEEDMDDFICDDTSTSESSDDERSRKKKKKGKKKKEEESEIEEEVVEGETEIPGPIHGLTESGKVKVDWWKKVLEDIIGDDFDDEFFDKLEHSGKLVLLLDIVRECTSIGDKVLVFSQSLLALDMIEDFLQLIDEGELELPQPEDPLPLPFKQWKKERDYLRLDGSSAPDARKNMCKFFNSSTNERCRLFLISTRAGGLGINLVAANRVIIFDSSWNPSHDTQSIFRVYRFGQKKPCYVYRFVAQGTMEEKIYSRQVTKMSTALRVVDEHQIKRYFKMDELAQLYEFTPSAITERETPIVPEDRLLAELLKRQKDWIVNYHEHDSLLENQTSEELSEEERKAAWDDYENEKKGFLVQQQRNSVMPVVGNAAMMTNPNLPSLSLSSFSFEGVVNTIKAQQEMCESVVLATKQIQKIHLNHYQRVQSMVYNLKNPMIAPEQRKLLPFGNHPEMLPMLEQQLRMLEENIQRENQVINHMTQITPQRDQVSMANLMSAGLIRGQPASTGVTSATANYVGRPSNAGTSTMRPLQQNPPEQNPGSNDVIMLD